MDLLNAITQALGIGLCVGVGGPLAALFVVAMAALGAGFDPEFTDWEFISETWFVAVIFGLVIAAVFGDRAKLELRLPLALFAASFGAIAGAASMAEEGETVLLGIIVGAIAGGAGSLIAHDVLQGARKRASSSGDEGASNTLAVIFAAAGIAIAAVALFISPGALVILVALAFLALSRRRKAGEKYEGLRILR